MEKRKLSEVVTPADIAALIRDKYDGDRDADISEDLQRLASGEPLAYIIGWIPFLGLTIHLNVEEKSSAPTVRPLIPRPETEYWTEQLITHLKERFQNEPFTLLDLCAGSGAIGLAVLQAFPNARVTFSDLNPAFAELILKNIQENNLDDQHAILRTGDLFAPLGQERFDIIATNPPYIPESRAGELEKSVTDFEPSMALFSGADGLDLITRIIQEIPAHLNPGGELWMECDTTNIQEATRLLRQHPGVNATEHLDQYIRPRFLTATFPV